MIFLKSLHFFLKVLYKKKVVCLLAGFLSNFKIRKIKEITKIPKKSQVPPKKIKNKAKKIANGNLFFFILSNFAESRKLAEKSFL